MADVRIRVNPLVPVPVKSGSLFETDGETNQEPRPRSASDRPVADRRPGMSSGRGFGQVRPREPDRHAAIADRGHDHLPGPGANISDREHSGPAALHQKRLTIERPPRLAVHDRAGQFRSGQNVAVGVEGKLTAEPFGRRRGIIVTGQDGFGEDAYRYYLSSVDASGASYEMPRQGHVAAGS